MLIRHGLAHFDRCHTVSSDYQSPLYPYRVEDAGFAFTANPFA
jgi:hypothetical protein